MDVLNQGVVYLHIKDKKLLVTYDSIDNTWSLPCARREESESVKQTLIRVVLDTVSVDIIPDSIEHYGDFTIQNSDSSSETMIVSCYTGEYTGSLLPSNEISKIDFFEHRQSNELSRAHQIIFDDLKERNLIL